jgi:hypothetical protein
MASQVLSFLKHNAVAAPAHRTPVYDTLAYVLPLILPTYMQNGWFTGDASSPLRTFQEGRTPFSTNLQVFGVAALYLTVILGGREIMQRFKIPPQQLKGPFLLHNIALSLGSGLLLALMLEEIVPIWYYNGFYAAICATSSWTPRMEFFYIINYMFKVICFRLQTAMTSGTDFYSIYSSGN